MKIALVGFMGTGKSSVGKLLAKELNIRYIDTDHVLVKKEGCSIARIFTQKGEPYFRELESETLKSILSQDKDFVLATGGGIVIVPENREILKQETFPILLTASPEVIYERTNGGGRPLLDEIDPAAKIRKLLKKREAFYHEFANKVDTDGKEISEVVAEILTLIGVDDNARA